MKAGGNREGLGVARMLMVLSSASPLFILWAIRGSTGKFISETHFLASHHRPERLLTLAGVRRATGTRPT
jgi:hypothetical protein